MSMINNLITSPKEIQLALNEYVHGLYKEKFNTEEEVFSYVEKIKMTI